MNIGAWTTELDVEPSDEEVHEVHEVHDVERSPGPIEAIATIDQR